MELCREFMNYVFQASTPFMGDAQGMLTIDALYNLLFFSFPASSPSPPSSHCTGRAIPAIHPNSLLSFGTIPYFS